MNPKTKTMAIEIPEEMVIEILSRLPAESLLRFRCVSKLWRSLISHPKFTLSSPSQRHLYFADYHKYSEFFYSFDEEHTSSTGPIPLKRMLLSINNKETNKKAMWHRVQILGSCNGFLLVSYYADLYLWNPTIRQCTKVLSLEVSSIGDSYCMDVSGLCYDSYSDDYKAVTVHKYDGSVTVISFRRKKWDKTSCCPLKVDVDETEFLDGRPAVLVNEKLHWLIAGRANPFCRFPTPKRIVYFDPLTDEFVGFPMPPPAPNNGQHNSLIIGLAVLEGCLCMARYVLEVGDEVEPAGYTGNEHDFTYEAEPAKLKPIFIEVLVMKEHGVVESWTRAFIISQEVGIFPGPYYMSLPFYFTKGGEVFVSVNGDQLLVYNPDEMSKRVIPLLMNQRCSYMASYVESLGSPAAYGHEEDWVVQGPDAWNFFFCSYTDFEDSSIEEGDISFGYDSDGESFHSTKEDGSIEEEDTSCGYCSDMESFHSTKGDSSTEEEDNCMF